MKLKGGLSHFRQGEIRYERLFSNMSNSLNVWQDDSNCRVAFCEFCQRTFLQGKGGNANPLKRVLVKYEPDQATGDHDHVDPHGDHTLDEHALLPVFVNQLLIDLIKRFAGQGRFSRALYQADAVPYTVDVAQCVERTRRADENQRIEGAQSI